MASAFYHVPKVPLPKEKGLVRSATYDALLKEDEEEKSSSGSSEQEEITEEAKEEQLKVSRQVAAAKRRRKLSTSSTIRYSTTLPIIPEHDDKRNGPDGRNRSYSERRYDIVMKGGKVHLVEETIPQWYDRQCVPAGVVKAGFLTLTVLFFTAFLIGLLLFTKSMTLVHSDAYVALVACLFWIVISYSIVLFIIKLIKRNINLMPGIPWKKLLSSVVLLTSTLVPLFTCSLPNRTAPRIQLILFNVHIPFTALANYGLFHRGIDCKQICCMLVLAAGIFVTMEPTVLVENNKNHNDTEITGTWYHSLLYALAWLPFSFWVVWTKKLQKKYQNLHVMSYLTWNALGVFVLSIVLFWINLIPEIGQADTVREYWTSIQNGIMAFYGAGDQTLSRDVQISATLTIIFLGLSLLCYFAIFSFDAPEATCYTVGLAAGTSAIGTIFWTLFNPCPNITIQLGFTDTGVFTIVGVVVSVLSSLGYAHFERGPEEQDKEETIGFARHEVRPRSRYPSYGTTASTSRPVNFLIGGHPETTLNKTLSIAAPAYPASTSVPIPKKSMKRVKSAPAMVSI